MSYRVYCSRPGCPIDARVRTVESAEMLAFAHEQRKPEHTVSVIELNPKTGKPLLPPPPGGSERSRT